MQKVTANVIAFILFMVFGFISFTCFDGGEKAWGWILAILSVVCLLVSIFNRK